MIRKALTLTAALAVTLTLALCVSCAVSAAPSGVSVRDSYFSPGGRVLVAARFGNTPELPENSAEAVASCAGIGVDIVTTVARKTADGVYVLCADEDISRCMADASGVPASGRVSELTLAQLSELYLFNGRGGPGATVSGCRIATLEQALAACGDSLMLMVSADWEEREELYAEVSALDALDTVIFRFRIKSGVLAAWLASKDEAPLALGYYRGNVNLAAVSAMKKCAAAGVSAVELSSANPYGVVFGGSVLPRFEGRCRAFVSTADPSTCGGRQDNEFGWDDLISRGVGIIETDYPLRLSAYSAQADALREELDSALARARETDLEPWRAAGRDTLAFEKALGEARAVLDDAGASRGELSRALYSADEALETLRAGGSVKGGAGLTPVKIAAIVLCAALVVAAQVYVFKIKRAR